MGGGDGAEAGAAEVPPALARGADDVPQGRPAPAGVGESDDDRVSAGPRGAAHLHLVRAPPLRGADVPFQHAPPGADVRAGGEGEGEGESLAEQLLAAVTGQSAKKAKRQHRDPASSGLDHCYDCTAELYILQHFLLAHPEQQDRLRALVTRQKSASGPRSSSTPVPKPSEASASIALPPPHIASASPSSVLSAGLAQQTAVIDQVIPDILQAFQLQPPHAGQSMDEEGEAQSVAGGEQKWSREVGGDAAAAGGEGKGGEGGDECVCLACLCVVMSDELSSELREGRTLLTAPLQPSAVGTANAKARKSQQKERKRQQQARKHA